MCACGCLSPQLYHESVYIDVFTLRVLIRSCVVSMIDLLYANCCTFSTYAHTYVCTYMFGILNALGIRILKYIKLIITL